MDILVGALGLVLIAELFLQGYSIAIGRSLFVFPVFLKLHAFAGFILLGLVTWFSLQHAKKVNTVNSRNILFIIIGISSVTSLIGYLGFAEILPGTVKLVYYSYAFLTFAYLLYFLCAPERKINRKQFQIASGIGLLMVLFWIFRWQIPNAIPPGISRIFLHLGFVTVIVLPAALLLLRMNYFFIIFLFYSILGEIYFIGFNKDFKYLTDVGIDGCVGYENALNYPVNQDPGISISELLQPPTREEITVIREEWKSKHFTPNNTRIEYEERNENGDSIKVISHDINGLKHYGLIRIPAGLKPASAPILLVLHGGGSGIDVLEPDLLYRIASGSCRDVLNNYVVIAPSFRGDIVRGKKFCFRSEGYTGDVWAGATEDAAFFLEAVKKVYKKDQECKTLAIGISRGATVALILSGLTDKITHTIAISTHTDFLNEDVFKNERVGSDFSRIFFTPRDAPENIRKKILTSSPIYFAEYIPSFEIHHGTADHLTTVRHSTALQHRLKELKRDSTARFHFYEGKGHGFDDDKLVCSGLTEFFLR
jgi:predicted esterase